MAAFRAAAFRDFAAAGLLLLTVSPRVFDTTGFPQGKPTTRCEGFKLQEIGCFRPAAPTARAPNSVPSKDSDHVSGTRSG